MVGRIERYTQSELPKATLKGLEPKSPEPLSDKARAVAAGKAKKARKKAAAKSKGKATKPKTKKRVGRGPKTPRS